MTDVKPLHPKKKNYNDGHRDRLREKFLCDKLMDYELFELLISYAIKRRDVKPVAKKLIEKFGNVHRVVSASVEELCGIKGCGESTAVFIKCLRAFTLLNHIDTMKEMPVFYKYEKLLSYCILLLNGKNQEEFHILYLDEYNKLLYDELHTKGTLDQSSVFPREIVKNALNLNAYNIVLVHNHPNGNPEFSTQDQEATKMIIDHLLALNINVQDHILVAGNAAYSAKNKQLMK